MAGINELNQQRKFITEALIVFFAYELAFHCACQLVQAFALVRTFGHNGFVTVDTRDFPTLSDMIHLAIQMLEGDNLVTSPKRLL